MTKLSIYETLRQLYNSLNTKLTGKADKSVYNYTPGIATNKSQINAESFNLQLPVDPNAVDVGSFVFGTDNTVGSRSFVGGGSNTGSYNNIVLGNYNNVNNNTVALGLGLSGSSVYPKLLMGTYNEDDLNDEYLYILGNGLDDNNRSNAFAVTRTGLPVVFAGDNTPLRLLPEPISVTYDLLVDLRYDGALIPGAWYRITDFVTTVGSGYTLAMSAGHQFDLIVMAIDETHLSERAFAAMNKEVEKDDPYFSTFGAKLEAWQVWYCLDNDTSRFAWADTENGKGVIYRLIDERGNDCPYDFKNIMFARITGASAITPYVSVTGICSDYSVFEDVYDAKDSVLLIPGYDYIPFHSIEFSGNEPIVYLYTFSDAVSGPAGLGVIDASLPTEEFVIDYVSELVSPAEFRHDNWNFTCEGNKITPIYTDDVSSKGIPWYDDIAKDIDVCKTTQFLNNIICGALSDLLYDGDNTYSIDGDMICIQNTFEDVVDFESFSIKYSTFKHCVYCMLISAMLSEISYARNLAVTRLLICAHINLSTELLMEYIDGCNISCCYSVLSHITRCEIQSCTSDMESTNRLFVEDAYGCRFYNNESIQLPEQIINSVFDSGAHEIILRAQNSGLVIAGVHCLINSTSGNATIYVPDYDGEELILGYTDTNSLNSQIAT